MLSWARRMCFQGPESISSGSYNFNNVREEQTNHIEWLAI
jgi:hypothetical protein